MYLVYKTDTWHSYDSRDIIGVCTSLESVYDIVNQQAEKEGESLSEAERFNLVNLKQTQGYSGEGEFQFEEFEEDVLL
jgi:hypothetical protein